MSETPKPNPELITGVPNPEQLKQLENERSLVEDTLSVDALKAVVEGRAEGRGAAELNTENPVVGTAEVSRPVYAEAQPTGEAEVPEAEKVYSRDEVQAMVADLKEKGKI